MNVTPRIERIQSATITFISGLVGLTIMFSFGNFFLKTPWGTPFTEFAYIHLSRGLSQINPQLPVIVLKVDDLLVTDTKTGGQYTDRNRLYKLLKALVELPVPPRAIGIDIDFSPNSQIPQPLRGELEGCTTQFFLDVNRLREKRTTPIVFGVNRTENLPYEERSRIFFGNETASTGIDEVKCPDYIAALKIHYGNDSNIATLASALVPTQNRKSLPPLIPLPSSIQEWLSSKIELRDTDSTKPAVTSTVLINLSKLDAFRLEALTEKRPDETVIKTQAERFAGRIVLIGYGGIGQNQIPKINGEIDVHKVSGRSEMWPGVYIHCCVIETLAQEPLHQFQDAPRLFLDVGIGINITAF